MQQNLKKIILKLVLIILILLLGSFMATQLTAIEFQFDSVLGEPLIKILQLYNPIDFWIWLYYYDGIQGLDQYFREGWICIGIATFAVLILAAWNNILKFANRTQSITYGSAHFATRFEVLNSGFLTTDKEPFVYVGAYHDTKTNTVHYLQDNSITHVFVFAPSRSGKGVGLIIPTLLSYLDSVIISDFKLENWFLTAGFRKTMGHKVIKFDPTCTDGSSARFNPLLEIRRGNQEVRDVQLIADMLVDPDGKGSNDHWSNSANSLLVSTILHVLYVENDKSLAGVRAFLSDPNRTEEDTLQRMLTVKHDESYSRGWLDSENKPISIHPVVASGAREMMNKSDGERASIISTALTFLKLYRDPIVAENTRGHDFTILDLVYYETPVSLYLGIPPSDISRAMPLMRLMLQMILSRLTESLELDSNIPKRRQLLLMLDEFPQFGRLPFFEKTLSYSAGYNIRAYLISQDMQQIYKEYGRDQSIVSNCGIRIAYAPNTLETAKHLSELLGTKTLQQKHTNYSGRRYEWILKNVSISEQEIKRPLLTPDELMCLPQDVSLIFKNGISPIYGRKIYYYSDKMFSERTAISPPNVSCKLTPNLSSWLQNLGTSHAINSNHFLNADPTNNFFNWLHYPSSTNGQE